MQSNLCNSGEPVDLTGRQQVQARTETSGTTVTVDTQTRSQYLQGVGLSGDKYTANDATYDQQQSNPLPVPFPLLSPYTYHFNDDFTTQDLLVSNSSTPNMYLVTQNSVSFDVTLDPANLDVFGNPVPMIGNVSISPPAHKLKCTS